MVLSYWVIINYCLMKHRTSKWLGCTCSRSKALKENVWDVQDIEVDINTHLIYGFVLCFTLLPVFIVNWQCDGDQSSIQHVFESQHSLSGEEWVPVKPAVTPLIPPYKGKPHYLTLWVLIIRWAQSWNQTSSNPSI